MTVVQNKVKLRIIMEQYLHWYRYKYSAYGIGFDKKGLFLHHSIGTGRNVIIFGADMSSSTKIDNRTKYIY